MSKLNLPEQLVRLVADVSALGSDAAFRQENAALLKLLTAAAPDVPLLRLAEAQSLMWAGDVAGARTRLEEIDQRCPDDPTTKAMLAMCLYVQGDENWRTFAEQTYRLPADSVARGIASAVANIAGEPLAAAGNQPQVERQEVGEVGLLC